MSGVNPGQRGQCGTGGDCLRGRTWIQGALAAAPPAVASKRYRQWAPKDQRGAPRGDTLPDVLGQMETDRFLTIYEPTSPSNGNSAYRQRAKLFSYEKANLQRA